MRGKLIVIFGIDGSGKSTILRMLEQNKFENTIYTSCLKKTVFEEELYYAESKFNFSRRDMFSREFKHALHIDSVIYNVFNKILPLLDSGNNVILDRYSICINLFTELFLEPSYRCLSKALECLPTPNWGIYFDTNIDVALQRIYKRSGIAGVPIHYSESKESLKKKKAGYEAMIPHEGYPIFKINANQDINDVYASVYGLLDNLLTSHDKTYEDITNLRK